MVGAKGSDKYRANLGYFAAAVRTAIDAVARWAPGPRTVSEPQARGR
jgi:hypothetical protein